MRLDRFLCEGGEGSRSEVKKLIKTGLVEVGGRQVTDAGAHVDPEADEVCVDGRRVSWQRYTYIMLNKPSGVLTATRDARDRTVLDLIGRPIPRGLAPVGRLDRDTEGLLILTDDGETAHRLLSPKSHVAKTYLARLSSDKRHRMDESDVEAFRAGIDLSDHMCLPAELNIISDDTVEITVYEGKFHQVKRMCEARGFHVDYLKRLSMGDIKLDEKLLPGGYRQLSAAEIAAIGGKQ